MSSTVFDAAAACTKNKLIATRKGVVYFSLCKQQNTETQSLSLFD